MWKHTSQLQVYQSVGTCRYLRNCLSRKHFVTFLVQDFYYLCLDSVGLISQYRGFLWTEFEVIYNYLYLDLYFQAGTQRKNDFITTSFSCFDVETTSIQRRSNVMYWLEVILMYFLWELWLCTRNS